MIMLITKWTCLGSFFSYSHWLVSNVAWLVCWSASIVWCQSWGLTELNWWISVSSLADCWCWGNPWLVITKRLTWLVQLAWLAWLVCVLRSHCLLNKWLDLLDWGLEHWGCVVRYRNLSLTQVWSYVDSVSFKNIFWNSASVSNETKSSSEWSWWVDCTNKLGIEVCFWNKSWQNVWNDTSFVKLSIFNEMAWIIHTKIFIDPDFCLAISCKSNHLVSDSSWNNHFWNIIEASDGIVKNDKRLLFVKSWDWVEKEWDSLSKDKSALLGSTESKTSWSEVGSNDLDPVCGTSSLAIDLDFIIEVSVRLNIEVVKVSLLSFSASHHFV